MDKIVVDSSVVIKWYVPQPYSSKARDILGAYQEGSLLLLAPDLIYAEIGNIIWKLHRFQGLSDVDAQAILDAFQAVTFVITVLKQISSPNIAKNGFMSGEYVLITIQPTDKTV